MRRKTALAMAFAVVVVGGCGHDPSKARYTQLSRAFASKNSPIGIPLPKEQAKCVAGVYAKSGLSAQYLKALAEGRHARPSKDDRDELEDVQAEIADDCLGD